MAPLSPMQRASTTAVLYCLASALAQVGASWGMAGVSSSVHLPSPQRFAQRLAVVDVRAEDRALLRGLDEVRDRPVPP